MNLNKSDCHSSALDKNLIELPFNSPKTNDPKFEFENEFMAK